MFIKFKSFFQIFIFSFFILLTFSIFSNSSFASSGQVGCYYTANGISFGIEGANFVGPVELVNGAICGGYLGDRLSCNTAKACYGVVADSSGNLVQLFNINGNYYPSNAKSLCKGSLESYKSTCDGSSSGTGSSGTGSGIGTGTGSSGTGSGSGSGTTTINITQTNSSNENQDITICSKTQGFLGFFSNKLSCESIKVSGNLNCIYNPYKNGIINSVIGITNLQFLHLKDNSSQNSCVPPSFFKSCYNYKTQDNCVSNPANLPSTCVWISGSKFSSSNKNILVNTKGICLQNNTIPNTEGHFNKINYDKRSGNLFSFKNSVLKSGSFISSKNSFRSDNTVLQLNKGGSISTNISNLAVGSTYGYSFAIKYVSGKLNLGKIKITITQFSRNDNLLDSSFKTIPLNSLITNNTKDIFKNINLNSIPILDNTSYITFTVSSISTTINLALIYFGILSSNNPQNINEIFSFVNTIPSSASSCNVCYVKNGLNTCTQNKSNLLGDCSYMVSNISNGYTSSQISNYFGNSSNPYLNNWSSQSLANAELFCGLYLTKASCINKNNFINSIFTKLNPHSNKILCKWNDNYGCFKDSTGNSFPDTRITLTKQELPNLKSLHFIRNKSGELTYQGLINDFQSFEYYTYKNSSKFPVSDFQLGCDMSPPISYIYLTAINSSGNKIYIAAGSNLQKENLGAVKIHISAYNIKPKSCNKFNFKSSIYLSEIYNNLGFYKPFKNTTYINNVINLNSVSKLKDGQVNISLILYDQSGNEGKDWNFSLNNVDLSGPNITLISPNYNKSTNLILNPLLKNSILNLSIKDFSKFNCSFNISSMSSSLNKFYYNSSNQFFNSSSLNNNIKLINISNYIFNSSSNPDGYTLSFSCQDIYKQKSKKTFYFTYAENTNFVLIKPKRFNNKTYLKNFNGFLSGNSPLFGISTSENLKNCSLKFNSLNSNPNLNIINRTNTSYPNYNLQFFKNITGNISFSNNGIKLGNIICYDNFGNKNIQNLTYIYSNTTPILKNFKLINNGLGSNNVVEIKGIYYTTSLNPLSNLIFNDNYSFVNTIQNLSISNSSNEIFKYNLMNNLNYKFIFSNITSKNFISNLSLSDFTPSNSVYIGIKNKSNLFLKKFTIYFNSASNISNKANFSYFYDNAISKFNFSTSQVKLSKTANLLFTTKQNPSFNITFNTPKYRTFTCNVSVINNGINQTLDFSTSSFLYFNLSDITGRDLSKNKPINLDFSCIDIYGNNLKSNYKLIFNNVSPNLRSVYFDNLNNKILNNAKNIIFSSLSDKLDFIGLPPSQYGYTCNYKLLTNKNYICNSSFTNFNIKSGFSSPSFTILNNKAKLGHSKCIRTPNLLSNLKLKAKNNQSLITNISYNAYCTNAFGLNTPIFNGNLKVKYITGDGLFSLTFTINNGILYPTVQSLQNYSKIIISQDEKGNNILLTLTNYTFINSNSQISYYNYLSKQGISKNSLTQASNTFYAIVKDSTGKILSKVSFTLSVDLIPPTTSIIIPDEVLGKVYEKSFLIKLQANDNKFVKKILLFENNVLVLNSSNTSNFNHNYFNEPIFNVNQDSSSMTGYIIFKNASINKTYTFKMIAYDKFDNYNSSNITVKIENGIGIILTNSKNSFVDSSRISWITKNNIPTINFNTTKIVNYCFIYPMSNIIWNNTNPNYFTVQSNKIYNSKNFSFNLENFRNNGFNLSKIVSKLIPIKISCMYNKTIYNYTRYLKFVNYLPDYVLSSKNGFIFNQKPYNTILNVKSVGPYRYLKYCNYSINTITNSFPQRNVKTFSLNLDLSNLNSGIHKLNLICVDEAGNVGPSKNYNIIINKNPQLIIKDITIKNNNGFISKPNSNSTIYVSSQRNLKLSFESNLKKGITCSYSSNSINGNFVKFINFFRNLFNLDRKIVLTSVLPYEFTGTLNLNSNKNSLDLTCFSNINTNLHFNKNYNILVLNKSFKLNVLN